MTAQLLLGHLSLEPSHHVVRKPDQPRGEAAWECPDQRPSPEFQPAASLHRDTMRDELAGNSSFQLSPRPSQPGPANAEQKPPVLPTATSPNARPTDSVSVTPGRLFDSAVWGGSQCTRSNQNTVEGEGDAKVPGLQSVSFGALKRAV